MAESQAESAKPRLLDKLVGILRGVRKSFEIDTTPIPLDQINPGTLARIIEDRIYNPVLEKEGKDRFGNGFTVRDALAGMNYVGTWIDEDLSKRFPEAHQATQVALSELHKRGVLGAIRDDEDQIVRYKVIDEAKLKAIAARNKTNGK